MNRPRQLEYQPALDGVRALAVILVVLFHLGVRWMPAGYLGVSVFFTLSGYLITTLLLTEFEQTGSVAFRTFYSRRARRLLPASLLVIVAIVIARWAGEFRDVPALRADLVGAVLQVFNWVQLTGSSSYTSLFAGSAAFTSPLAHYWSLAIEEQFYLVWPLTLALLCRWAARRGKSLRTPLVALAIVFAVVAPLIGLWFGRDAAYWATPARLGELLVGAVVAAWMRRGVVVPTAWRALVPIALGAIVFCALTFPSGAGPAFTGWLTPFALVSAALIVGLQVPSRLRSALSTRPLVWIGRVSYGLYLVHWPVFVLLRQHGARLTTPWGATVALAITLAITAASYRLVEHPIRAAPWTPARTARMAAVALVVALIAVVAVPVRRGFLEANQKVLDAAAIDTGAPTQTLVRSTTSTLASTPMTTPTTPTIITPTTSGEVVLPLPPAPNRPVRMMVVGDSTAFYVGEGLAGWAVQNPAHAQVDVVWCQGCGFITDGSITSFAAGAFVRRSAQVVANELPRRVKKMAPDVVVLMTTLNDVADRRWTAAEGTLTPRDPAFRARMSTQYRRVTDRLTQLGVATIVWVLPPVPVSEFDTRDLNERDRYEIQHEVIREVATSTTHAGTDVVVCDMAHWMTAAAHDHDTNWRPDGTHFDEQSGKWLAERWLGPWLEDTALGRPVHASP